VCGNLFREGLKAGFSGRGRRDENRSRLKLITGKIFASSSAVANDGRPAVDTTMIGLCCDIWNLDPRDRLID